MKLNFAMNLEKKHMDFEIIIQLTLQNTFVRYNHWMSEGCNRCMS